MGFDVSGAKEKAAVFWRDPARALAENQHTPEDLRNYFRERLSLIRAFDHIDRTSMFPLGASRGIRLPLLMYAVGELFPAINWANDKVSFVTRKKSEIHLGSSAEEVIQATEGVEGISGPKGPFILAWGVVSEFLKGADKDSSEQRHSRLLAASIDEYVEYAALAKMKVAQWESQPLGKNHMKGRSEIGPVAGESVVRLILGGDRFVDTRLDDVREMLNSGDGQLARWLENGITGQENQFLSSLQVVGSEVHDIKDWYKSTTHVMVLGIGTSDKDGQSSQVERIIEGIRDTTTPLVSWIEVDAQKREKMNYRFGHSAFFGVPATKYMVNVMKRVIDTSKSLDGIDVQRKVNEGVRVQPIHDADVGYRQAMYEASHPAVWEIISAVNNMVGNWQDRIGPVESKLEIPQSVIAANKWLHKNTPAESLPLSRMIGLAVTERSATMMPVAPPDGGDQSYKAPSTERLDFAVVGPMVSRIWKRIGYIGGREQILSGAYLDKTLGILSPASEHAHDRVDWRVGSWSAQTKRELLLISKRLIDEARKLGNEKTDIAKKNVVVGVVDYCLMMVKESIERSRNVRGDTLYEVWRQQVDELGNDLGAPSRGERSSISELAYWAGNMRNPGVVASSFLVPAMTIQTLAEKQFSGLGNLESIFKDDPEALECIQRAGVIDFDTACNVTVDDGLGLIGANGVMELSQINTINAPVPWITFMLRYFIKNGKERDKLIEYVRREENKARVDGKSMSPAQIRVRRYLEEFGKKDNLVAGMAETVFNKTKIVWDFGEEPQRLTDHLVRNAMSGPEENAMADATAEAFLEFIHGYMLSEKFNPSARSIQNEMVDIATEARKIIASNKELLDERGLDSSSAPNIELDYSESKDLPTWIRENIGKYWQMKHLEDLQSTMLSLWYRMPTNGSLAVAEKSDLRRDIQNVSERITRLSLELTATTRSELEAIDRMMQISKGGSDPTVPRMVHTNVIDTRGGR